MPFYGHLKPFPAQECHIAQDAINMLSIWSICVKFAQPKDLGKICTLKVFKMEPPSYMRLDLPPLQLLEPFSFVILGSS